MSNTKSVVKQPRILDQQELQALIEKAQSQYKNSHAACIRVNEGILPSYTNKVLELVDEGYSLHPTLPCSAHPGSYVCYMLKPEHIQQEELEQVAKEVEEKYLADIEAFNSAQMELLTRQLLEQEKAKEKKKQEEKEAKQFAQARAEAEAYFASILTKQQEGK